MVYSVIISINNTDVFTGIWQLVAHSQSYTFHIEFK